MAGNYGPNKVEVIIGDKQYWMSFNFQAEAFLYDKYGKNLMQVAKELADEKTWNPHLFVDVVHQAITCDGAQDVDKDEIYRGLRYDLLQYYLPRIIKALNRSAPDPVTLEELEKKGKSAVGKK